MWCLEAFLKNDRISEIILVSHADILNELEEQIGSHLSERNFKKTIGVVPGGKTRQESVFLGLQHLDAGARAPDYVLVHDAARPFLKQALIDATIDTVIEYGACSVAVPVSDTIKAVENNQIVETLDRSRLVAVHTPQASRFDWLLRAHQEAAESEFSATDDAVILERSHHEVKIVQGDRYNIKVTVPEDLKICEALSDIFVSQIMDA